MDLFNQESTKSEHVTNPTRVTIGNVSVQATKSGASFTCLTLIVERKLTINKPLSGLIDVIKLGVFSDIVTENAKEAIRQFHAKYASQFSL